MFLPSPSRSRFYGDFSMYLKVAIEALAGRIEFG